MLGLSNLYTYPIMRDVKRKANNMQFQRKFTISLFTKRSMHYKKAWKTLNYIKRKQPELLFRNKGG